MKTGMKIALVLSFSISSGHAKTFYVDPVNGNMLGDGSSTNPWHTLEEVINSGLIRTKDISGLVIHKGAPIKAGDTIKLKPGYHGAINIKNAYNDLYITVVGDTPDLNQKVKVSGITILSAKNWRFSKLTISPSFSDIVTSGPIVSVGATSRNIIIRNSHIYSFDQAPETLTVQDWEGKAKIGIESRYVKNLRIINNYINNVAYGLNLMAPYSVAQGNVISDFSYDGIRAVANNLLIQHNVIKNNHMVNDINLVHPDAIQGFPLPPNTLLSNVTVAGNIILNRDNNKGLYSILYPNEFNYMQGISFFDGTLRNVYIVNNLVMPFHWHGIALYDSKYGKISSNFIFSPLQINKPGRITFGTKSKGGNINNTLMYNKAYAYFIDPNSIGLISLYNKKLDINNGELENQFKNKLKAKLAIIDTTYGKYHPVSGLPRVNPDFVLNGTASVFN